MKHCAYFSILLLSIMLSSCNKHEEISFAGKVMWVRECTSSPLDNNVGYVVELEYPEGVGKTIVSNDGVTVDNLIVLYEPTSRIMVDDHIHGTFYLDDKYSKSNCSIRWDDYDLPEGVFTKTLVD